MTRALVLTLVRLVVVAAAYYAAARLGLGFASIGESISLIWPPAGSCLFSSLLKIEILVAAGYEVKP